MDRKLKIPILFFLLSFANTLGVTISAALPALREYFHITKAQSQSTISLYLIGCFLGTILYAPIANAIGKRPVIYIGGGIAVLGSIVCIIAIELNTYSLLLFGRCLTAIGAVSGPVLTNLLLSKTYPHEQVKKIYSYLMSGFAIIPAFGIAIGGLITKYISWQGCFYFMLLFTVFLVGWSTFLPEIAKERDWSHFHIKRVLRSYGREFSKLIFTLSALLVACIGSVIYIFSAEAPFIAMKLLHMSESSYGLLNLIPNIGVLIGGFLSVYLGKKLSMKAILGFGGLLFFLVSVAMWISFDRFISVGTLFLFPLIIFLLSVIVNSNGTAYALKIANTKAYASASTSMTLYFVLFLSIEALRLFSAENSSAMPTIYTIAGALTMMLWIVLVRRKGL